MSEFLKAPKHAPKHPLNRRREGAHSGHKIGSKQVAELVAAGGAIELLATACTPQAFQAPIEAGPITGTTDIAINGIPANLQGSLSGDCVKFQFDQNGPMIQGVQLNFNPPSAHIVPAPGSEGVVTGKALIGMKNGDGTCTDPAAEVAVRVTIDTDPTVCTQQSAQGETAVFQCDGPGVFQDNGQTVASINGNQAVVNMGGARAKDFVVSDTVGNTSVAHGALPTDCQVKPEIRIDPPSGQAQMHVVCNGPGDASTAAGSAPILNNEAWVPVPPGSKDFPVTVKFNAFQTTASGHVPDLQPPVLNQGVLSIAGGKNTETVACQTALQDTCTVQFGPATVSLPGDGAHTAPAAFPATLGEQPAVQVKACDTLGNCSAPVLVQPGPYKPFDGARIEGVRTGDNQLTVRVAHAPDTAGNLAGPGSLHGQQERPFRDVPWVQDVFTFGQEHGIFPSTDVNCFPTQQTSEATIFTCNTPHSHGTVHLSGALVDANGNWSPAVQGMVPVPDFPGPVIRAAEAAIPAGLSVGLLIIAIEFYLLYQLHRTNKNRSRRQEAMDIVNSPGLPKEKALTALEEELHKDRGWQANEVIAMLGQKKILEGIRAKVEKPKRMFDARPFAQFRETFAGQDKEELIEHDYVPFVKETEQTERMVMARLDEVIASLAENDGRYIIGNNQNDRDESIRFLMDIYRDGEESWFWQKASQKKQLWKNDKPQGEVPIYPHLTRENLECAIINFHVQNGTLDQEMTALYNLFNPAGSKRVRVRKEDMVAIAHRGQNK